MVEGGDGGGISLLVLQNGGKHRGAVLLVRSGPDYLGSGARCSRGCDDARRLQAAP